MEDSKKKTSTSLLEKGPQKVAVKEPLSVVASDKNTKRKNKKSEVQQEKQDPPSNPNQQDTSEPMEVDEIPILIKSDSE